MLSIQTEHKPRWDMTTNISLNSQTNNQEVKNTEFSRLI